MIALGIGIGLVAGAVVMAALYLWMRPEIIAAFEATAHVRLAHEAAEEQLAETVRAHVAVKADRNRLQREVDALLASRQAAEDRHAAAIQARTAAERAETQARQALHRAEGQIRTLAADLKTIAEAAGVSPTHPSAATLVAAEISRLKAADAGPAIRRVVREGRAA